MMPRYLWFLTFAAVLLTVSGCGSLLPSKLTNCGLSHFSSRVSALPLSPEQRPVMKGTMAG